MSRTLKIFWAVWLCLAALVVGTACVDTIVTTDTRASLVLEPGAETEVDVFRLLSSHVTYRLGFKPQANNIFQERPSRHAALGDSGSRNGYYPTPGEPIRLRLADSGTEHVLEAKPANRDGLGITRPLVLYVEDGDEHRFPRERPTIPSGWTPLKVTVLEVGETLRGEKVDFLIEAPVTLKTNEPEYNHPLLLLFPFFPVYAGFLLILLIPLAWKTLSGCRRSQK